MTKKSKTKDAPGQTELTGGERLERIDEARKRVAAAAVAHAQAKTRAKNAKAEYDDAIEDLLAAVDDKQPGLPFGEQAESATDDLGRPLHHKPMHPGDDDE